MPTKNVNIIESELPPGWEVGQDKKCYRNSADFWKKNTVVGIFENRIISNH